MCLFQYISCCSLSNPTEFYYKYEFRFNTSHVVVYPKSDKTIEEFRRFQYISCCSLSTIASGSDLLAICFNTSHVVVYQKTQLFFFKYFTSFNTSHVVVYQLEYTKSLFRAAVSIHLML